MKNREVPVSFRWLVLGFGALGHFDLQMNYLSVAPVLETVAHGLGIDAGRATILLMSTFLAAGSVSWLLVGGAICDRYGVFVSLLAGFVCLSVPATLTPWLGMSPMGILSLRAVEGLSMGFMYPAIPAIANTLFAQRQRGLASGLLSSAIAVGASAGVVLGPLVLGWCGGQWQWMPAVLAVVGWVGLAQGAVLYTRSNSWLPRQAGAPTGAGVDVEFREALVSPLTLLGIATSFLAIWSLQGVYSLAPTFLSAARPLGAGYGGLRGGQLTLGATLVAGALGPILNGFLLDKVFHGRVRWNLTIGFGLLSVCVYLLRFPAITGNVVLLETDLILAGLGPMLTFPTMFYLSSCSYPQRIVGRMGGLWSGIGNCGGVSCLFTGGMLIARQNSYQGVFALQAGVAVLGVVATNWLVGAHRRSMKAQERQSALCVEAVAVAGD